ncbi:MAG: hypothetical protein U9N59_15190 [Campylobacterota bacterium]|nr:hypothetical protein [Campylobacterota bacterium]
MKNFINVRVQGHNNSKNIIAIAHNIRYQKSLSSINEANNIFITNGVQIEITKDNKKGITNTLKAMYRKDRAIHNEIYKSHNKRNLRESKGSWCEGVFTFSEAIHQDLHNKYSLDELIEVANNSLNEIASKYGGEVKYMVLHMCEKVPHFHFQISNFDTMGRSLTHTNKNKEFLSELQDIGYKHFKVFGMQRGIKKDSSIGYDYISPGKWHKKQLINIKDNISSKSSEMEQIDQSIKELKTLRNSLSKSSKLAKNEKKSIYSDITKAQKQLRSLRKSFQIEKKSYLEFQKKIDLLFKEHHSRFGDNAILKEKILEELGEDIMLKASQKRLEQQNKNLKNQVEYLQEISQSKVDFQNAFIEEEEKNNALENKLIVANNTIQNQKEKLIALNNDNIKGTILENSLVHLQECLFHQ